MKNISRILKSSIVLILLITNGLTTISQNNTFTITSSQLKQIRLLANQAEHDSCMLIQKQAEIDSLIKQVTISVTAIDRLEQENDFNQEINAELRSLAANEKSKTSYFQNLYETTKTKMRNRTIILYVSAGINLIFIIKSLN